MLLKSDRLKPVTQQHERELHFVITMYRVSMYVIEAIKKKLPVYLHDMHCKTEFQLLQSGNDSASLPELILHYCYVPCLL